MGTCNVYRDQGWDSFARCVHSETGEICPGGQCWGQLGTGMKGIGDQGGAFRHPGTSPSPICAMLALTGSQKLSFAIVGLVATVVLIVWPIVRPKRYSKRELDDVMTHGRLRRELEGHQDD
jgi:hypothetical protein